jgi:RNA polymerase sigma-70 factor (ECF subfamily)
MSTTLIIRLRQGDESCFQEIYELYNFKVFCFIKKYVSQQEDCEDIAQNVFIHLWKYRYSLDPAVSLDAVLFKSSKQEISKWYKKQNKVFPVDEILLKHDKGEDDFQSDEELTLRLEKVEFLLKQIPEKRRKIFKLHKFEERSYKEIAAEMDMSTGAVANQISKTLQYLKKNLIKNQELYWFAYFFIDTMV